MHASKGLIALTLVALASTTGAAQRRDTRLADAAERRDAPAIQGLVKQKTDLNAAQPDGATALHWVAHWDDVASAELLLKNGANANVANDAGVTPLALACENGSAAMVEALLKGGANPNTALLSGETPLMTAARSGNLAAVKSLIAKGANVNAKESTHGQTALMWAASNQHPVIVQTLVENGADVHARSEVRPRAVHTGNRFGDRGDSKGALTMDLGGFTPLLFAARQGDLESGRLLLAAGATANEQAANGASALVVAAHSGQGAFAKLLLERGADPNAAGAGYSALHAAVLRGDAELVKALLARGADPNTPIAKGTPSRYYSKDWALNVNALGGATPLWQAARYGDVPIMRTLAAAGANIKFTMPDGTTTLMAAVAANNGFGTGDRRERYIGPGDVAPTPEENERLTREVAAVAIELGADVNAASQTTGDTALHLAATQALDSVVQLLVDKGANIEAANKRGLTPLGTAELLRRLGAKEPDPKTLVPPQMPGRAGDYLQQQQQREQRQQQQQGQPEQKPEPK